MTADYAALLKTAMNKHISTKFGHAQPPSPYITPFGIRTLDALLGDGLASSAPIAISSTPETGKTTISLQFGAAFQRAHKNSVVLYINIEEASGGGGEVEDPTAQVHIGYHDIQDRIQTFGINPDTFLNKPVELNVQEVFGLITDMINIKRKLQEKTNEEYYMLIIWDSIAATPSSKDAEANSPNEIIGFKARELTLGLSKIKQQISMERCSFIIIDQVRANMKIDGPFSIGEKSVGDFGNFKAATSVSALQHNLRQWLFLSKSVALKQSDPLQVDGWITNVYTEKNKLAPSQYSVPIVFDKKFGAVAILSEYVFMRDITKVERKFWKTHTKLIYPLCITSSANSKILTVTDPDTKNVLYKSDKFMERNFINKYNQDPEFQHWFNRAVDISVDQRIKVALFRDNPAQAEREQEVITAANDDSFEDNMYPETTEVQNPPVQEQSTSFAQQFDPDVSNIQSSTTPIDQSTIPEDIPDHANQYQPEDYQEPIEIETSENPFTINPQEHQNGPTMVIAKSETVPPPDNLPPKRDFSGV